MKEVTLDQGALGHSKVKPTTLMTDIPEVLPLHGMKAAQGQCTTWSDDLETRLQEARDAAEWSPGLVQVFTDCNSAKAKECNLCTSTRTSDEESREVERFFWNNNDVAVNVWD